MSSQPPGPAASGSLEQCMAAYLQFFEGFVVTETTNIGLIDLVFVHVVRWFLQNACTYGFLVCVALDGGFSCSVIDNLSFVIYLSVTSFHRTIN